jgi:hypothetical protein
MEGFFKVYRKIINSNVFANQTALKIWIWCLAKVTYKERFVSIKVGKGEITVKLMPGQFLFGRFTAEEELNIDGSTIYKWMKKFASPEYEMITIESTNQYSIITICKWEEYQSRDGNEVTTKGQQSINELTTNELPHNSEIASNNQPHNTNKNNQKDKKEKNHKSEIIISRNNKRKVKILNTQFKLPFSTGEWGKSKDNKSNCKEEDYLSKIVSQFCESFQTLRQNPYVIMNPSREKMSVAKIVRVYKEQYPDSNPEDTLNGLRRYFDQCINISDPWLYDNMSLQLIESKFNQINTVLSHGNKWKANSKGATGQELATIVAKHLEK